MLCFGIIVAAFVAWFSWEKSHRKTRPMAGGIHRDIRLVFEEPYELYHNDLSLCSKKVRACLAQMHLPYKSHHIDLIETGSYEVISRKYLATNPSGLVPVLVHEGHPIYESHEIIAYLAEQSDGTAEEALVPAADTKRELMQRWVDRASLVGDAPTDRLSDSAANCVAVLTTPLFSACMSTIPVYRILEGLLFHRLRFRPFLFLILKVCGLKHFTKLRPLMVQLILARDVMNEHLDALEEQLSSERSTITGEQITLADISWLVILERLVEADWFDYYLGNGKRPRISEYWQQLKTTPAYRIGIAQHRHPAVAKATASIRMQKQSHPAFKDSLEGRG